MAASFEKRFVVKQEALPELMGWIEEKSAELLPFDKALNMQLAVEEAVVNIVSYAYEESKVEPFVVLRFTDSDDAVTLDIEDGGKCFNQLEPTAYNYDADVENRQIGGLGRHFIVSFTDKQSYKYSDSRNILTLVINK